MMKAVHFGDRLHDLRQELLRARVAETAAGRRRDAIRKWKSDGIIRMSSVYRSGVSRSGRVHHIVDGIQRERNIVRNPKDPIASANQGSGGQAVRQSNARRKAGPR